MNMRIPLALALITLSVNSVFAQRDDPKPQINVSGSAELKVAPDEVDLKVGVETRDETLAGAKRQNDERVSGALSFLRQHGINDKDIQTDYIAIEPFYDEHGGVNPRTGLPLRGYDKRKLVEPEYFQVRKSIGITLTNITMFESVLTGLITNGVNHVLSVDFRTSELRKYKDRARAKAIHAAKEKAQAMAAELGVRLGKPSSISVNDWSGWTGWRPNAWGYGGGGGGGGGGGSQNVSQNSGGGSEDPGATVAVGQISISANVSVSFFLE